MDATITQSGALYLLQHINPHSRRAASRHPRIGSPIQSIDDRTVRRLMAQPVRQTRKAI